MGIIDKQINKLGGMNPLLKESKKLNSYLKNTDDNLVKIAEGINKGFSIINERLQKIEEKLEERGLKCQNKIH